MFGLLLPKRKCVSLHPGIEEPNFERVVGHRAVGLSDKLVEALTGYDALPSWIDIRAVAISRRSAINCDAKSNLAAFGRRAEYKMQVTRVKTIDDAAILLIQRRFLAADRPVTGQAPVIQARHGDCIGMSSIRDGTAGRHEILRAIEADIGFC
jgi:hypothetical protein